jgi:hypothetical protein
MQQKARKGEARRKNAQIVAEKLTYLGKLRIHTRAREDSEINQSQKKKKKLLQMSRRNTSTLRVK